jgi:hypothetical protein
MSLVNAQYYKVVGSYNFRNGINTYKQVDTTIYGDSMKLTNGYTNHYILSSHPTYSSLSMPFANNTYILSTFSYTYRSNKNNLDTNSFKFTFKNIKNKVDRIRVKYHVTEGGPYTTTYYVLTNNVIDSISRRNFTIGTHYMTNQIMNEILNYSNIFNLDSITLIISHQFKSNQLYRTLGGQVRYDSIILEKYVPVGLPISIKKFFVEKKQSYNEVTLITASEKNVRTIEVLKMNLKNEFEKIGEIVPVGNSSTDQEYSFFDKKTSSENYYKLRIIDYDEHTEYSDIIFIKNKNLSNQTKIYPNIISSEDEPKFEIIDLNKSELEGEKIEIISSEGKKYDIIIQGGNIVYLPRLSVGIYFVKYKNETIKLAITY